MLRTELRINNTQAQLFQLWSGSMPTPLPERLEWQEQIIAAHLNALKRIRAAAVPLYNALSPEQKQSADTLMGMMGGLW